MSEPIERSAAGLRDSMFAVLEQLRDGKATPQQASAAASVANTIIKSIEMQITYEKLRLASEVPATLGAMSLVPVLPVRTSANGQ